MKDDAAAEARREGDRQALHQVDRQGPAQGDVQDGHLDLPVLLRRADFRRGRPQVGFRRRVFHRHRHPHRRRRPRRRSPRNACAGIATPSATRRSIATRSTSAANTSSASAARTMSGPPARSSALQHAVRGNLPEQYRAYAKVSNEQSERLLTIRGLFRIKTRRGRRPQAGADRGGRAGQGHRQALRDRRDVVRLDLARGAHHARDRDEPDRRQVEHRRRRRGSRPLQAAAERRLDALGDQAGGVGPLRRHRPNISSTPT